MRGADELRRLVDERLAGLAFASELGGLVEALGYALLGGGKRIRPVLCLATGEALGREPDELLPAACALELVHTFSLVHDDLPALDVVRNASFAGGDYTTAFLTEAAGELRALEAA